MINSEHKINLLWLSEGGEPPDWDLGEVFISLPTPEAVYECLKTHLPGGCADAWLFWGSNLGSPTTEWLQTCLTSSADVWHAGLQLGLAGQPVMIDFVQPTWMLNRDPDPSIEATSWRLSLRACLICTEVLRQLGGPDPHFEMLDGAGLELGYRYMRNGAFVRHVPALLPQTMRQPAIEIPISDQFRFLRAGFEGRWLTWAVFRAILRRLDQSLELWRAYKAVKVEKPFEKYKPYQRSTRGGEESVLTDRVSVLIPTLRRYPYLRTLLGQLRAQTVQPLEILVIDQTPPEERDALLLEDFADLPIRYFTLDQAGQCTSRNLGLQHATGEFILFIDDDDEIPPDLIEKHLARLQHPQIDISNGVAHEVGAGELPPGFQFQRTSDVFPTNNTMVRKEILMKSGLFDLAYDHGQRADHDLGMRLYLAGELLVLNPEIAVLHHHAPMGGLRDHKARVDTYAASRQRLFKRNLPTVSDLYLGKRYFSARQVNEMVWISLLGTFSLKGPLWKRLVKSIISLMCLPHSLWTIYQRSKAAEALLQDFPQIPSLIEEKIL